ncbi:MAG: hypothetical protein SFY69_05965 [Planctomycetota bacterium]|nr:hypothetical protein [Planctomycetota bacterium]
MVRENTLSDFAAIRRRSVGGHIAGALAVALVTGVAGAQPEAGDEGVAEESRFGITLGADVTNAYFFRGIRQETTGFILQPYADVSLEVFRAEDATLSVKAGMWNSYHGTSTGSSTGDSFIKHWYEADIYAGFGLATGEWAFDLRYIWYTSPNDAFGTVDEIDFSVAYDDTEHLGAWALKPAVTLATELGSNAADGARKGTYLQVGVSPGFSIDEGALEGVAVTFPAAVGLSLSNYYEGTGGENDAFGFASIGVKVSVPIPTDPTWGSWTASAGVQVLFLGDAAETLNRGDTTEVIGTVGVSATF